jgi:carbonic anhydrase
MQRVVMSNFGLLLARNRVFAATNVWRDVPMIPRQQAFLITCLDPRVDPGVVLGLEPGDALVVRNAGGRVTDAVIGDVAFISFMGEQLMPAGPLFEVAVLHHTQCGTGLLADEKPRQLFARRTGYDEAVLAATAVTDPAVTVRADVEKLLSAGQVSPRITVSGHVYDVETGLVTTVVEPGQSPAAATFRQGR